jgi:hypothetical protein
MFCSVGLGCKTLTCELANVTLVVFAFIPQFQFVPAESRYKLTGDQDQLPLQELV